MILTWARSRDVRCRCRVVIVHPLHVGCMQQASWTFSLTSGTRLSSRRGRKLTVLPFGAVAAESEETSAAGSVDGEQKAEVRLASVDNYQGERARDGVRCVGGGATQVMSREEGG